MNFRNRNLFFVDLEMTGLDPNVHEISEVGYLLVDGKTFEVKEEFSARVKFFKPEKADPTALKIFGYSEKKWKDAVHPKEILDKIALVSDEAMVVGWNVSFDWMFLKKAFSQYEIRHRFDYHVLDAMSMAYAILRKDKKVEQLGLRKVGPLLGVEVPEEHGALDDIRATYEVFKELIKRNEA